MEPQWLASGAVDVVSREECEVVCPMWMRKEPTKYRPIFDGRYLNSYVNVPTMKYEALRDLGLMCEAGMKSVAFDLKDGYHAINLAPEIRKYVCF